MSRNNFGSAPRQPLLWAACAFACGILVARYCWRPAAWWVVAAAALMLAAALLVFRRNARLRDRASCIAALLALIAAGALAGHARGEDHIDALCIQPYARG